MTMGDTYREKEYFPGNIVVLLSVKDDNRFKWHQSAQLYDYLELCLSDKVYIIGKQALINDWE